MTTEEQLTRFREEWQGTHVTQHEDCLVYSVAPGFGKQAAIRANKLIEVMELDLIATPTTLTKDDSFTVKIKQNGKDEH